MVIIMPNTKYLRLKLKRTQNNGIIHVKISAKIILILFRTVAIKSDF